MWRRRAGTGPASIAGSTEQAAGAANAWDGLPVVDAAPVVIHAVPASVALQQLQVA